MLYSDREASSENPFFSRREILVLQVGQAIICYGKPNKYSKQTTTYISHNSKTWKNNVSCQLRKICPVFNEYI